MLMTAAIMIVAAGCQKSDDGIDVSLKSSGAQSTVNNWLSGNAATECEAAGGNCAYAYKIDEWDEEFGMDGAFKTLEGNTIFILNSNGKTFDWTSEFPVCKVIVKAGRGAIIYTYPEGGVYEDTGLIGFQGKGISHVTFCYSEPYNLIIAVKAQYRDGMSDLYCESSGRTVFITTEWCGVLGVNDYPSTTSFEMVYPGTGTGVGTVEVENGDVTVTLYEGKILIATYLYIGTLEDLQTNNLGTTGCPEYWNPQVWMLDSTPETNVSGLSFMFFDL